MSARSVPSDAPQCRARPGAVGRRARLAWPSRVLRLPESLQLVQACGDAAQTLLGVAVSSNGSVLRSGRRAARASGRRALVARLQERRAARRRPGGRTASASSRGRRRRRSRPVAGSSTSGSVRRWWATKWPCSPATIPTGRPARRPISFSTIAISSGSPWPRSSTRSINSSPSARATSVAQATASPSALSCAPGRSRPRPAPRRPARRDHARCDRRRGRRVPRPATAPVRRAADRSPPRAAGTARPCPACAPLASVAAAHVPTSAELASSCSGVPDGSASRGPYKIRRRGSDYASLCRAPGLAMIAQRAIDHDRLMAFIATPTSSPPTARPAWRGVWRRGSSRRCLLRGSGRRRPRRARARSSRSDRSSPEGVALGTSVRSRVAASELARAGGA